MKNVIKFIFVLVFFGHSVFADQYYDSLFLGEKKTPNYQGPLDPRSRFNEDHGQLILLDDIFKNDYLNQQIENQVFSLQQFWVDKLVEKSNCPNSTLEENFDYIRYIYRLLAISYIYESLKLNHQIMNQLAADKNLCSISYDSLFKNCTPKSADMKKFQERVYGKLMNENLKMSIPKFNKNELSAWLDNFLKTTSLTTDLVNAGLYQWCRLNGVNCKALSLDEIKNALARICTHHKDLILNFCSENDSLYGASYIEKMIEVIQSSNAFNLINKSGMGEDCLRRYVKIFAHQENNYKELVQLIPLVYSHLLRQKSRYLQGDLFLPGALKEFDMKGLSDFLSALKPPKITPVIKILPKLKPKLKPSPPMVMAPKILKPEVVAVPPPVIEKEVEPALKISEFERALIEFESKNLDLLLINMEIFREDFEFSSQVIADLAMPIKKFQTRAALTDMKIYDHLGSVEAPLGLVFLKFLIDTENHQGLFNILSIVGDHFFVINDFEKKNRSVYIELKNDQSTNNQWQFILKKAPVKELGPKVKK